MAKYRIECIEKVDRYDPCERITHVGGRNPDGSRWMLSQGGAISGIETGKWSFFVRVRELEVAVVVKISRFGHKYLKTEADGERPDNLPSLRECS